MDDLISRQEALQAISKGCQEWHGIYGRCEEFINALPPVKPQERTGHCKDCKHFCKLPYHADTLGKCIHHTGFCPKGDWYCADYEPQESEGKA